MSPATDIAPDPTATPAAAPRFTRKQRRHLIIAFLATVIATLCILFGGN